MGRSPKKKKAPLKKAASKTPAEKKKGFEPEIKMHSTAEILFQETAHLFMQTARAAVNERGRFVTALSGGLTPKGLFQQLAEEPYASLIPWEKTYIFWVDERHVPLTDPISNYYLANEVLFTKVPVLKEQIFPVTDGSLPVAKAASAYESKLRKFFGGALPRFDLSLMGMGDDGHTASLFPGRPQLNELEKWVVGYFVDPEKKDRVSLTLPVLNASRLLVVLLEGKKKADRLKEVLEGPSDPPRYPVQYLRPVDGRILFAMDAAAASLLKKR
jgi:6-phosphogluconolactonase